LVLLNIEQHFLKQYKEIPSPNEQYLGFYKKRGTKMTAIKEERILESIGFKMPIDYLQLYYNLMHTHYINENSNSTSYSVSLFFEFIVTFISNNGLEFYSVEF
jgi:outer membrane usher protein FimD/PapC